MSYFKKFTDFCAGVAAFVAALFLIRKYMSFYPDEKLLEEQSKLAQFMAGKNTDATMYVHLIFFLVLSVIVGIIFRKLPYVCLGVSLVPAIYVAFMFGEELLYEQPALYIVAIALHVIGNLAECIFRDKEDGRHRLFVASKVASGVSAAACFIIALSAQNTPEDIDFSKLNSFQREIYYHTEPDDPDSIMILGWMFVALLIIGIILYNIYFVDALLSLIPLGYALYLFFGEELLLCPFVFVTLAAICATANIFMAVFENNLSRKEQERQKNIT